MNVFVTGATGWVGATVVQELLAAGHHVTGLARSDDKAAALSATGAQVVRASLDELDVLRTAAGAADAVIHTAFNHDFSKFAENAAQDQRAIEAMGDALVGSARPLVVTSGLARLAPGRLANEADIPSADFVRKSETTARSLAERGVRAITVRLAPTVHGIGDHGFVPILIRLARETGVAAYPSDGSNRWAAVHRLDAAKVFRLAIEQAAPASVYHAVAEEGVTMRAIAEAIGRGLGLPVASREREHFGWFADFASADMAASSDVTRAALGWQPAAPGLLNDLAQPAYYRV
ncbi:SDR family oxidoreductase [Pandoraea norimbergensis]|uniref:3-beta hydroxysteroid dehydrogenase n=1 Tax=Pandoraea norimbergensis TaxID=93219 RepID=A0ABM5WM34_9BURK|nr:SDR family oxidoreductase [Pandoraea norimbergensis]ALS61635.1 3-beta hydroxysteroid dehydrogenase [Pandoraea norimbergensis]